MKNIAIIGGGIAGMSTALYLAKAGHAVTIFERDEAPLPSSSAKAFEWDRRGAPQVRHSHAMLARLRNLLREDHPEVYSALLAAGAQEMKLYEDMPRVNGESVINDADKEIVFIACRRATLEWVMRTELNKNALISFHRGADIAGLMVDKTSGVALRGLVTTNSIEHEADIVIVADGRRSSVPKWLSNTGIELDADTEESAGIQYFSRFYRLKEGKQFPTTSLVANDLGYLFYSVFCGDNRHFSIALSANEDDDLRFALRDPDIYEKAVRQIPELNPWVECGEPTTKVFPMAGLVNRRRNFVSKDLPVLPGLHVVGDAHICTNPAYGRGLSLAVWQAKLLAESIEAVPDDLVQQSLRFCKAVEEHIVPWFDLALMMDQNRTAEREQKAVEGETEAIVDSPMKALTEAANEDPDLWRDFWRTMNLLQPPGTLMTPEFLERVMAVSAQLKSKVATSDMQALPDRDRMMDALGLLVS